MDPRSFEQIAVSPELFGASAAFLGPGAEVSINYTDDGDAVSGESAAAELLKR
jgi:translation elongation factor P/translation initiation factor 5A